MKLMTNREQLIRHRIAELRLELSLLQRELLEHSNDSCNCNCDHGTQDCEKCGFYGIE